MIGIVLYLPCYRMSSLIVLRLLHFVTGCPRAASVRSRRSHEANITKASTLRGQWIVLSREGQLRDAAMHETCEIHDVATIWCCCGCQHDAHCSWWPGAVCVYHLVIAHNGAVTEWVTMSDGSTRNKCNYFGKIIFIKVWCQTDCICGTSKLLNNYEYWMNFTRTFRAVCLKEPCKHLNHKRECVKSVLTESVSIGPPSPFAKLISVPISTG